MGTAHSVLGPGVSVNLNVKQVAWPCLTMYRKALKGRPPNPGCSSGELSQPPRPWSQVLKPLFRLLQWVLWWPRGPWGREESARLSGLTFTFHFHALEKEMATHSSVLAWRIPGTGEPGGLPSMGLHRVGHDWSDLAAAATEYCTA